MVGGDQSVFGSSPWFRIRRDTPIVRFQECSNETTEGTTTMTSCDFR